MPLPQLLLILAIAGAFGVFLPIYKGFDFLDPRLIVAYACLSAVIAAPIITDAFAEESELSRLHRLLRAWVFSWLFAAALLALALFTMNASHWHGRIILPRTSFLIAAECLSLTLAAVVASLGALLAGRFAPINVKAGFRAVFLLAAVALFLADRYGALAMSTSATTRLLFIVSSLLGAAALVMHLMLHVMLKVDPSNPGDRRRAGGV